MARCRRSNQARTCAPKKGTAIVRITPWSIRDARKDNHIACLPDWEEIDIPQIPSIVEGGPVRLVQLHPTDPSRNEPDPNSGTYMAGLIKPGGHRIFYIERCGRAERRARVEREGGNVRSEEAVSAALQYLKAKQNPDGSWGASCKGAMTGLALLCYFGHCEVDDSPDYGDSVLKGLLYLKERLKKAPDGILADASRANSAPYEHAIATAAICEFYRFAQYSGKQYPGWREAAEHALETIIRYQHPDGSWGADAKTGRYSTEGPNDLSITAWQCVALKAARFTGFKFGNHPHCREKAVQYIEAKETPEGGIGNTDPVAANNQWDLTGAGMFALRTMALSNSKDPAIQKGIEFAYHHFQQQPPNWQSAHLASWYFYSEAFHQHGGPEWKLWNDSALPMIVDHQNKDGSWHFDEKALGGGIESDDLYATCLCTLMLEVYYRHPR